MNPATEILTKAQLHNTHWGKRIIAADKRGGFTHKDVCDSDSWVTCACGKSSNTIEWCHVDNQPLDGTIRMLGTSFNWYVNRNNYIRAAETLVDIEQRAYDLQGE